jgi:hypothetical protein
MKKMKDYFKIISQLNHRTLLREDSIATSTPMSENAD